ncbi:MAG: efflux RND transporter permease subunit [Solirubrobacteraceae bacterium]
MRWIIGTSLRLRFLVAAGAAALMFFGAQQLHHQKVDVFPEFAPTRVEIQTACLGLSAAEVEELVSVPLEDALNGVPGVETIRSESVPQLSNITLLFKRGTDLMEARQRVQERLQSVEATLPTWAAPPFMMPPLSATSRIMSVGLTSKKLSQMDVSMIAYWKIRARLLRVPGVANVALWGEQLKQLQVQADPRRMAANGVSLDHLMEVTSNSLDSGLLKFSQGSWIGTGGWLETGDRKLAVRHIQPIVKPSDLAKVPLARRGGRTLSVGNVANVLYGPQPPIGDAVVDGGPGLLLVIEKFPRANTVEVTQGIETALKDLQPGLHGITVHPNIFKPASFIQEAVHNLTVAVIIGCLLVVLILVAFLFEWRAAFISLISIPLSLVAAGIVLDVRGATVNTLILAGFAVSVGVVVDDAIIDMENIVRRLRIRRAQGQRVSIARTVLDASLEVRNPILFATLINVIAVAPVLFVGGLSGAFFEPLAVSYGLAVMASMAVALTVTPALALIMMKNAPPQPREPILMRGLKRGYGALLSPVLRRPFAALAAVGMIALAAVLVYPRLGQELFPTFKERDFLMHWVSTPGTSINEERRMVRNASHQLARIPGITDFGSHIGQAFLGEEIAGPNFGENWVRISPNASYDDTIEAIHKMEAENPGLFRDVQTYLRERIDEVLAGSTDAMTVRIFGEDLHVLRREAGAVQKALKGVPGLVELHTELQADVPQIDVQVRLPVARRYGIKPGDVRRAAATLLASEEVGDMFRGGKAYDVHVWSTPQTRRNLSDIRALRIDTSRGRVPLGVLATVAVRPTPNDIKRENASRRIDVGANVSKRDLGSVTADVQKRLASVHLPLGYHMQLLGEAAERQAAQKRLLIFAAGAALAILLLLQVAFGSWRLAWLLFLTLPMALVGGLLAAFGAIGVISLGALIGFYTVLGIAARNGILLISHFQHLERNEGEPFGPGLVLRGARERLSPILMTAFATGLALLPLALSGDKPGQEIEHPLAIVILGGLATSLLLNLFLVPTLYLRFGRKGHREERRPDVGPPDDARRVQEGQAAAERPEAPAEAPVPAVYAKSSPARIGGQLGQWLLRAITTGRARARRSSTPSGSAGPSLSRPAPRGPTPGPAAGTSPAQPG